MDSEPRSGPEHAPGPRREEPAGLLDEGRRVYDRSVEVWDVLRRCILEMTAVGDLQDPFDIDVDSFNKLLFQRSDSAPGPDGLPYGAWKTEFGSALLYTCYRDMASGATLPPDFA